MVVKWAVVGDALLLVGDSAAKTLVVVIEVEDDMRGSLEKFQEELELIVVAVEMGEMRKKWLTVEVFLGNMCFGKQFFELKDVSLYRCISIFSF
jgi:hypothetical protein